MDAPDILLINPWIHDFAAYDFWAKPLGILRLAAILREHGISVRYIDCLDRFHPKARKTDPYLRNGRGMYLKTRIPKPKGLEDVSRNFSRYGILPEWFREDLSSLPKPDLILVTSLMTYWYPGVQETIEVIRDIFPDVPIILGGIYASLCHDHAIKHSGADEVVTGPGEDILLGIIGKYCGFSVRPRFAPDNPDTFPWPAFDLQRKIPYIPILTSSGCPFSCAYCASHFLNPKRMQRKPELTVKEITYWHEKYKVSNFAFYDDALLADPERNMIPLLEDIISLHLPVCFHTPNAIHLRNITRKIAELMFRADFRTLRLGLETTAYEERSEWDKKVTAEEFVRAVSYLKEAGFTEKHIGAYLLIGLPHQSLRSVEESVMTVRKSGITPVLAYYTPIPHTRLWEQAVAVSRYDLEADPIFTNNTIFPCNDTALSWETIFRLKNL